MALIVVVRALRFVVCCFVLSVVRCSLLGVCGLLCVGCRLSLVLCVVCCCMCFCLMVVGCVLRVVSRLLVVLGCKLFWLLC